ncbi:MAG: peptidoglycan-binding protein [Fibrobacteres bacterium]|nr:peptidoglycan-binding protein [Fibrobacterota bacterium]
MAPRGGAPATQAPTHAPVGGKTRIKLDKHTFHVKFQMLNPLSGAAIALPKGIKAHLFNRDATVGDPVKLDSQGKAALTFTRKPTGPNPPQDFSFGLRLDARTYLDIGNGKPVKADSLGMTDKRDLFEIPLEMRTSQGHFKYGAITGFAHGRFANYAGTGAGTKGAPLLFTLNLHWYPLQFRFYDILTHALADIPRGLCVQPRLGNQTPAEALESLGMVGAFQPVATVTGIKQRLRWLGFYKGDINETEDAATRAAIEKFQKKHKLEANGRRNAATEAALTEAFYRRRVSVMQGAAYLVPVLAKDPPHAEVQFQMDHKDLWVFTKNDKAAPVVQAKPRAEVGALAYPDRFKWYDLPDFWTSREAQFRRGGNMNVLHAWKGLPATLGCYPAGNTAIPAGDPLQAILDDMVLLQSNGTALEAIAPTDRYAVFGLDGEVRDPDPDQPYLSMARNAGANYFAIRDDAAFAIHLRGNYYFGHHARVPANLAGAGLRAAVLGSQVTRDIQEPLVPGAGNLQENYFHGVDYRDGKVVSYLIVYWSCKLARSASTTGANIAIVDAAIVKYKKFGMVYGKKRHEEPDFEVIDKEKRTHQRTKVLKHFVVWDTPSAKCSVSVHNGRERDNMELTKASFAADSWQATNRGWQTNPGGWFTAAHEMGHACGLDDDYIEPPDAWIQGWTPPIVPRFNQWVKGNPLAEDSGSLMGPQCMGFRHRQLFHHVNWMNTDPAIRALTGNVRFLAKSGRSEYYIPPRPITLPPAPGDRNFLTTETKHIHYIPVLGQNAVSHGTTGNMDLVLYKVGNDQTLKVLVPNQEFDAILCVCLYVRWAFQDVGSAVWQPVDKENFIKARYDAISSLINRKKYLGTSNSTYFKKIYLLFRLYFHEGADSEENKMWQSPGTHIQPHFDITAWRHNPAQRPLPPSYHTAGFQANIFDVDENSHPIPWFRFMLGLQAAKIQAASLLRRASVTEKTTLKNSDLGFLRDWANTHLGAAGIGSGYSIKDF